MRTQGKSAIAKALAFAALATVSAPSPLRAQVTNLRVVTDAFPDVHDLEGFLHSATSRWEMPAEKCWALFYWVHLARRQTNPMVLHGLEVSDPIRQFNDFGHAQCSTVAGMNCALWHALGYPVRYWDITLHTVSEVFYEGRWHVYDNSMSALYTLCDGATIAGVEDVGKEGACEASGGRNEPGHIARYHCLTATSPNGFLTGADCDRDLEQEATCFRPSGLKHRWYFYDWDMGHRYILNIRRGESYTRHHRSLGSEPGYYVPSRGVDPEAANPRYKLRGNGLRRFVPSLRPGEAEFSAHSLSALVPLEPAGLRPAAAGAEGEAIFKIEGSNILCSLSIRARFRVGSAEDEARILVSATNGLRWKEVWRASERSAEDVKLRLVDEVNGAYEVLVKVVLRAARDPKDCALVGIEFEALTQLNSKTLPRLNFGLNRVHVSAGAPLESVVLWPDLRGSAYKDFAVDEENIATLPEHPGYQGVLFANEGGRPAHVTFRIDAPREIRRAVYGGRLYNRAPGSRIRFLHSFDGGTNWIESYRLERTDPPWDVIHFETIEDVPSGVRSILFRYAIEGPQAGASAASIYSVRMEANSERADPCFRPIEVTFRWKEVREGDEMVERSHTEIVEKLPHSYEIATGGLDHPEMCWLRIASAEPGAGVRRGYSDGTELEGEPADGREGPPPSDSPQRPSNGQAPSCALGGAGRVASAPPHPQTAARDRRPADPLQTPSEERASPYPTGGTPSAARWVPRWVSRGKNLALGKPYKLSVPSRDSWGAGDPEVRKLTDGVIGPPYAGGRGPTYAVCWAEGDDPEIEVDLGREERAGAFRIHVSGGWPWWDALRGEVRDRIDVETSLDGKRFEHRGTFDTRLRRKDVPVNHMLPDDETATGPIFELVLPEPVPARYVRFRIRPARILTVSEVEVLDWIRYEPFDLRIALPGGR